MTQIPTTQTPTTQNEDGARPRRIMHIWLKRFATDRHAKVRSRDHRLPDASPQNSIHAPSPWVTVKTLHGALILDAVHDEAKWRGLAPGMSLSEARAQVPELKVDVADPEADAAALEKIGRALERYTPFVGLDPPDGLYLDTSGCSHLFGGEAPMAQDIVDRLARWGIAARVAVADNPSIAWGVARFGRGAVVAQGQALGAIGSLPVAALRLPDEMAPVLSRLGLKTVDSLFAQPRVPLIRRFGGTLARRMDQALGLESEPITPLSPIEPYLTERRFAEPLMELAAMHLFVKELAERLANALSLRGRGQGGSRCAFFMRAELCGRQALARASRSSILIVWRPC